ncbi:MAG: hypothetical protein KQH57_11150 [Actinomycetales bacterium]|nr:hypothetical protein [Actinomycetales bacterium]
MDAHDEAQLVFVDQHLLDALEASARASTARVDDVLPARDVDGPTWVSERAGAARDAAVSQATYAQRAVDHAAAYASAARATVGDVAAAARSAGAWPAEIRGDGAVLGRLCGLADEVAGEAQRRLATARRRIEAVRAEVDGARGMEAGPGAGALRSQMEGLDRVIDAQDAASHAARTGLQSATEACRELSREPGIAGPEAGARERLAAEQRRQCSPVDTTAVAVRR